LIRGPLPGEIKKLLIELYQTDETIDVGSDLVERFCRLATHGAFDPE
jgi:hypothetical protein